MRKIVIDTNFLLSVLKFKVKMPRGNIIILSVVVDELSKLAKSKSKTGGLARAALRVVQDRKFTVRAVQGRGDKAILRFAVATQSMVATNDRRLIKALKANGIKVIRIRQKKYTIEE